LDDLGEAFSFVGYPVLAGSDLEGELQGRQRGGVEARERPPFSSCVTAAQRSPAVARWDDGSEVSAPQDFLGEITRLEVRDVCINGSPAWMQATP
jgi:hypothetical protein